MLKRIAVFLFLVSGVTNAASFDCTKAISKTEKLICSTPALSQADDALYVDYLQAKLITSNSDDFKALVKQNWKLRENNCDTEECLLNWYKRSTELYRQIAARDSKKSMQSSLLNSRNSTAGVGTDANGDLYIINGEYRCDAHKFKRGKEIEGWDGALVSISGDRESKKLIYSLIKDDERSPDFAFDKIQLDEPSSSITFYKNDNSAVLIQVNSGAIAIALSIGEAGSGTILNNCIVTKIPAKEKVKTDITSSQKNPRKTLDDFFRDNPELSKNIYIKNAIKDLVGGLSYSDIFTSERKNKSALKTMNDNLVENGYDYARLSIRTLQENCNIGMASVFGLKESECRILSNYQDKD